MKFFVSLILWIVFLLIPHIAHAQESWVIRSYDADIRILNSGVVRVEESIVVDFNELEKHGIFRFIPYVYEDESTSEKTYSQVDILSVTEDGKKAEYDTYKEDNSLVIKIGDPDKTISEEHTYIIMYDVTGVLRGFEQHDELYWNVIGPYWEVPIESATATVNLPEDAITNVDCFVGTLGSTFHCSSDITSPALATFTTERVLNPYEAFTIVVGYQKGIIPLLTVEPPKSVIDKLTEWPSIVTFLTVVLLGFGIVLYQWFRLGRDYWTNQKSVKDVFHVGKVKPIGGHETIVVEYTPPDRLPPAVLGVLVDERAHTHDVTATIIDLATRGYLTITEIPKKWLFGNVDYTLMLKKDDFKDLLGYEKLLLQELFESGHTITVSDLKKTFYDSLKKVKDELYNEVTKQHLFPKNPEKVRSNYLGIGFVLLVGGISAFIFMVLQEFIIPADIALGVSLSGLLLIIVSQFMPRRSAYGRELYRRVKGYELFIGNVEKHRQKFFESKNMFNEVLPYAIVFGLTKKFADAMDQMGVKTSQTTTGWYHGVTPLNTALLASHISDFSNSVGTAIASTPSSSGGFSGGSSGGGFGGGGGGSW